MLLGKKAFISTWVIDIWAYIIWVLVILVFLIISKFATDPAQNEITSNGLYHYQMNHNVQAFLHAPIEYQGMNLKVMDILHVMPNAELDTLLASETNILFQPAQSILTANTINSMSGVAVRIEKHTNRITGPQDDTVFINNPPKLDYFAPKGLNPLQITAYENDLRVEYKVRIDLYEE
tara:strand:+ start:1648 stop:2181 length:534 start_codon:yes stop_codon:yes gene_type:complete